MTAVNQSVVWVHNVLLATVPDNPTDPAIEGLQDAVLTEIADTRPAGVVLDLSGVQTVDSFFARTISETADMVALMGAETIIVGIQPPVAMTAAELGYGFESITTARDTDHALEMLGVMRSRHD